jgi:hypothetical protein
MLQHHAHREAVQASVQDIATTLQDLLSRRVTAYLAGVRDAKTVSRWSNGEITEIRVPDVEERLRTAYRIATLMRDTLPAPTIKAWFLSLNPSIGNVAPVQAIRDGRGSEAIAAASLFLTTY